MVDKIEADKKGVAINKIVRKGGCSKQDSEKSSAQ
jgi:hypothetical protein